jgi:hypothetical protein
VTQYVPYISKTVDSVSMQLAARSGNSAATRRGDAVTDKNTFGRLQLF